MIAPLYKSDALQIRSELDALISIFRNEGIGSYLEIGARMGGSLWPIATSLPEGSRVVAVDMGGGTKTVPDSKPYLIECVDQLKKLGYDAHLIWGDSTDRQVIEKVFALGPFDATFIDGNHTLPYVESDWLNYGRITRKIVAFHDINWHRDQPKPTRYPIQVPQFWNELKIGKRTQEFRHDKQDNGIGVLWL